MQTKLNYFDRNKSIVGLTGVAGGDEVFASLTRTGVRFPPAPLIVSSLNGYSPPWDWRVPPLGGKNWEV